MNMNRLLLTTCAMLLAGQINSRAQALYHLSFRGSSSTTDPSGRIVSHPINNGTLLKDFAALHNSGKTAGLGLAYHIGGNELGDTIDVINTTNGAVVYSLFGLYFGESFGRMELPSASGRQIKRIEYVYTDQNSHSLGSVLLTTYYWFDSNGNTNATAVLGSNMQYLVLPNNLNTNVQVCTASFRAIQPWLFKP